MTDLEWLQFRLSRVLSDLPATESMARNPDAALSEETRQAVLAGVEALRSVMPTPTEYRVGIPGTDGEPYTTLENARAAAKALAKANPILQVFIDAKAGGLTWTVLICWA